MKTETGNEPILLPLPDAADVLGIDVRTLRLAIARHQIPAVEIGHRKMVPRTALMRLAEGSADVRL